MNMQPTRLYRDHLHRDALCSDAEKQGQRKKAMRAFVGSGENAFRDVNATEYTREIRNSGRLKADSR